MKVLYVRNEDIERSHYTISQVETVKALRGKNIDARLMVKGSKKSKIPYLIELKNPLRKNRYYMLYILFYLPYYVIKNKMDYVVIDEKTVFSAIILMLIKKIFDFKIILDVRTVPVEYKKVLFRRKLSYKIATKLCDGAIFITKATQEVCEKEYGLKFKKTTIVTSAANVNKFNKNVEINLDKNIVDKLKNHFVLLYHGTISPNRGVQLILDAVSILRAKIPNILFLSISNNNQLLKNYCQENELEIDDSILYMDTQDNAIMPQYIKLADAGIIPYIRIKWWEISSPLKLMEYASMEKPIILSDIKAHTDVIPENSDFVVYFNPDIKNELADKILYAYENLRELKNNTWKGRKIIVDNYSWDKLADRLNDFFQNLSISSRRLNENAVQNEKII